MKALDTNVLVRFLVEDDEQQSGVVYNLFKKAEAGKSSFFVPLLVVLETLWVLESVYKIPRKNILDCIHEMLLMPVLKFEAHPTIQRFLFFAQKARIDLSDILIACSANGWGCESVLTFDKKAAAFELFEFPESIVQ